MRAPRSALRDVEDARQEAVDAVEALIVSALTARTTARRGPETIALKAVIRGGRRALDQLYERESS